MNKHFVSKLGMGVALVSMLANAMPVAAQVAPSASLTGPAASTSTTSGRVVAVTRDDVTGGFRAPQQGDNSMAIMTIDQFVAESAKRGVGADAARQQFDQIAKDNGDGCAETGAWVRESIAIANESMIVDDALVGFYHDLNDLGRAQNGASNRAMGTQVVATGLLCGITLGLYCAAAAVGAVGNIGNISANKKANKVDRDMRYVNVDQSRVQIRGMLLNMRATIGWAKRFQKWCMIVFPNETAGNDSTQSMTVDWGYPTRNVSRYSSGYLPNSPQSSRSAPYRQPEPQPQRPQYGANGGWDSAPQTQRRSARAEDILPSDYRRQ